MEPASRRCGCLAAETDIGVVHVCHAADTDITGFAGKPIRYQWQLIKMPTAPLIRLEMLVRDKPLNPYQFESFYNVTQEDQVRMLDRLAGILRKRGPERAEQFVEEYLPDREEDTEDEHST